MSQSLNVRALRTRMGLTQEQFAAQVHVTPLTVLRWESGQSTPRPLALARLREVEAEATATAPSDTVPRPGASAVPALDFASDPDAVSAVAEAYRLAYGHQFNPAFASEISRIDALPHQRIAVYEHMLPQDPLRFLLADDAGAGKTIMAGLLIREMLSRGRIGRVLVVPPAGLVGNWERELRTLFGLTLRIVRGADARAENPFEGKGSDLAVISLDTLAGGTAFKRLCVAEPYDLVIFDEAHKLSASTQGGRTRKSLRYRLAEAIAGCAATEDEFTGLPWSARHLLLLTATPHMGKDSPYYHLWRLLDPHAFATAEACRRLTTAVRSRHFIRRTKEEMVTLAGDPLYRQRTCATFDYALTPDEQALYEDTTKYLDHTYDQALENRGAAKLACGVFQRRMASSTWALLRSFERRIEKLQSIAAELASGSLGIADLRGRSLDRRYGADYFDSHSADEDGEEDGRESSEHFEDAMLGAVVAVTIEDLKSEVEELEGLRARARAILDSGRESKFEKLREVLEDPLHADEKWLVFTEHRDTMEYLVRRLEGLGHAGRIAHIHGGMDWPERDAQVEHFRDPDGARYLIATDAAGEGINLQFCAFMANYDIPWNPARLEQRMGRIHRYGQARNVRIANLVSGATREGRVLQVLLEKLDAIREELRSDKVFDVIGRLFEGVSLRDYMAEALTAQGEQRALARLGEALTTQRMSSLRADEDAVLGLAGDVAGRLSGIRADLAHERYLQLLPGYVWRFVEKSAKLLELGISGDLATGFTLLPLRPGALDPLLPALQSYPPAARDRLCVRRPAQAADAIWLHPGEPVFDALSKEIIDRFGADALRGTIFVDPQADAPYLCHLAIASVELAAAGQPDARSQLLEHRLAAVRQHADAAPALCDVEPLLLLHGNRTIPPGAVPLASRGIAMRAEAASYLQGWARQHLAGERRATIERELPDRLQRLGAGFDLRESELAGRRAKLARDAARSEAAHEEFQAVKQAQRALSAEREAAAAAVRMDPERIAAGPIKFLLHALAVPASEDDDAERHDEQVEQIAVRIATAWETDRGARVVDVSKPDLARASGLTDWPGFDLLATQPDDERRSIEVKGRRGRGEIQLEPNEWRQACNLGDRYWLYVVFDCATPTPLLVRIQDPFTGLLAGKRESFAFRISAKSVLEAGSVHPAHGAGPAGP